MPEHDADANCKQAEMNGLIRAYFPNGSSWEYFIARCWVCHHHQLPDGYDGCAWKIIERINGAMDQSRYGYGTSYHPPEDIEDDPSRCPPLCLRFTHRNDGDKEFREPQPPPCKGQMNFGELDVPVERVPNRKAVKHV